VKSKVDPNKLEVFSENRRRKRHVGILTFDVETRVYQFAYDIGYLKSRSAIPIGPDLPLKKRTHQSAKGKLFAAFLDRIPSKQNPAYVEYCEAQGISPDEKNPIILLGAIGRRGPSTFVFEPVFSKENQLRFEVINLRNKLNLSIADMAAAFDLNPVTFFRFEKDKSRDKNVARLLEIYLTFPDVTLWVLRTTGRRLHQDKLSRLVSFFTERARSSTDRPTFSLTSN
jgi:HipA-like protein